MNKMNIEELPDFDFEEKINLSGDDVPVPYDTEATKNVDNVVIASNFQKEDKIITEFEEVSVELVSKELNHFGVLRFA